jgi:chromosome partitioning protein
VLGNAVLDLLREFPVKTLKATVGQRVIFAESLGRGGSVIEDAPAGAAADEIRAVLKELQGLVR